MSSKEPVWIVVKNTAGGITVFPDHRGSAVELAPSGKPGDSVQIDLEPTEHLASYIRKYEALKAIPGLRVLFSNNVQIERRIPKMVVTPNPLLDPRIAALQEVAQKRSQANKVTAARLARIKAEQAVAGLPSAPAAAPAKAAASSKKVARLPKVQDEVKEAISDLTKPTEGTVINQQTLSAMTELEVQNIATQLEIVTEGRDKETLIGSILAKV